MLASLRNLPVARKFTLAFGIVAILGALQGGLTIFGFISVNKNVDDIVNNAMPSVRVLSDLRVHITQTRRSDLALLVCPNEACMAKYAAKRESEIKDFGAAIEKYAPMVSYPGERELYDAIRQNFSAYLETSNKAHDASVAGRADQALALLLDPEATKAIDAAQAAADSDTTLNNTEGAKAGNKTLALGRSLLVWIASCVAVTLALSIAVGWVLTRIIAPPLQAATSALERVAAKDLTVMVESTGADEVGRLCHALNSSVESMRSVLSTVAQGAESVSAAATEMSVRSTQSNGNAQSQTGKTNQIAAAAQEMTATIGEISHNAETAAGASQRSAAMAHDGSTVMQAATATMERISTATGSVAGKMTELARSSEEIGKVVNVIQDISEQTNLLALNAAIEAARAGEHGRGFAVVAGEVRRLAERTRSATQEIGGTIRSIQEETRQTLQLMEESNQAVASGIDETGRAQQSLEAIVGSAREVEHMIQMIATAANEQTAAAGEISESATHISQLATENSHAAEETAEGCKQLSVLANDLDGLIRQFKLGGGTVSGESWRSGPARGSGSLRMAVQAA